MKNVSKQWGNTHARKNHPDKPKHCTICGEFKQPHEYYLDKRGMLQPHCAKCQLDYGRIYRMKRRAAKGKPPTTMDLAVLQRFC